MNELIVPCVSYVLLMTFTPGPNNVSSSALGLRKGYRGSLPYLLGIATGFLVIMVAGGLLTEFLTRNYSAIAPWLKWVGVVYMAWLAFSLFVSPKHNDRRGGSLRDGFAAGAFLQFVNPKGILYGITVYGSFSSVLTGTLAWTLGSAVLLTIVGFAAVSTWCLVGSVLAKFFEKPAFKLGFNIVMAALLVYSAVSIILH